jgi:hypothetical protein
MKTEINATRNRGRAASGLALFAATLLLAPLLGRATGSWQTINNFPYSNPGHMLLLTDGTAMVQQDGTTAWYRLQPDSQGHYLNGNWSALNSMAYARKFYASQVLQNGKVLVAGGEYGGYSNTAEIYDPISGFWSTTPSAGVGFGDAESILLANGQVLVEPVGFYLGSGAYTFLYDPVANQWSPGPTDLAYQDESTWVKLPDDSILSVDIYTGGTTSERYIPYSNTSTWVADAGLPVSMAGGKAEVGGGFMLSDGRAFWLGGSGYTAFYTPSGDATKGHWKQGPNMPYYSGSVVYTDSSGNYVTTNYSGLLTTRDTPAAMMNNGKILCQLNAGAYHNQVWFYEFDLSVSNFVAAPSPLNTTPGSAFLPGTGGSPQVSDATSMLDLPDGTVLYNDTVNLYIYTPDAAPLPAGKPAIRTVTWNTDGSLHLTGTLFDGISQGASFGDDAQQDSNYPLVRFTDAVGNVSYGQTFNWSSTGVQTGDQIVSTECWVASEAYYYRAGFYSLQVVANGNASDPVPFYGPVWVDFTYATGLTLGAGTYARPYALLGVQGTAAVASGGTIALKGQSIDATGAAPHSTEILTISKPMTLIAIGGPATIGQ